MEKVLDHYKASKLRRLFHEKDEEDFLSEFDEEWVHRIEMMIYFRLSTLLTSKTLKMYHEFHKVTKNVGLIQEIAKKLTLLELYYQEWIFKTFFNEIKNHFLKNNSKILGDTKGFDKDTLILHLLVALECKADQTIPSLHVSKTKSRRIRRKSTRKNQKRKRKRLKSQKTKSIWRKSKALPRITKKWLKH